MILKEGVLPMCINNQKDLTKYFGHAFEWLLLEFGVWIIFLFTMLILLIQSRFKNIGIDQSISFEPINMAYMANTIVEKMKIMEKHKYYDGEIESRAFFVGL